MLMIPIYVLVAVLFAIYIPELFPTEVRMRASGICNTFGRGATILTPFLVVALFKAYRVTGVVGFLIALLIAQIFIVIRLESNQRKKALRKLILNCLSRL